MYNSDHTATECIGQKKIFSSLLNQLMSSLDSFIQLCGQYTGGAVSSPSLLATWLGCFCCLCLLNKHQVIHFLGRVGVVSCLILY
jgi:hypothetical protein